MHQRNECNIWFMLARYFKYHFIYIIYIYTEAWILDEFIASRKGRIKEYISSHDLCLYNIHIINMYTYRNRPPPLNFDNPYIIYIYMYILKIAKSMNETLCFVFLLIYIYIYIYIYIEFINISYKYRLMWNFNNFIINN